MFTALRTLTQRSSSRICANCHAILVGQYCHNCGQRKMSSRDFSIPHFIGQAIDTLTHIDSKFYQSIKYLIFKPGFLSAEFVKGKQIAYMKPVQLFLLINIIYFFSASVLDQKTFTTPLYFHLGGVTPYRTLAQSMVSQKIQERGVSIEEYETHFDKNGTAFSKTLIFIMIPVFALLLQLFYIRAKRFYVEHLVFSIHFFAFLLFLLIIGLPIFKFAFTGAAALFHYREAIYTEYWSIGFISICLFFYLSLSLKTFYKQSVILSAGKSLLLTYSLIWVLWFYRMILFFSCFYTT